MLAVIVVRICDASASVVAAIIVDGETMVDAGQRAMRSTVGEGGHRDVGGVRRLQIVALEYGTIAIGGGATLLRRRRGRQRRFALLLRVHISERVFVVVVGLCSKCENHLREFTILSSYLAAKRLEIILAVKLKINSVKSEIFRKNFQIFTVTNYNHGPAAINCDVIVYRICCNNPP